MSSKSMPQRFGKYVLLRKIAVGGMAEIFKAKVGGAEGFEKDLVIKRILSHFSEDEGFVQMFVDEARLTAKLQHPNIVQIFDFDVQDGQYYIAMEYIEGKDLKDVLVAAREKGERFSVTQCAFIVGEVAKALQHAHTKEERGQLLNIVHRDVTPSNIMISYNGDVKLMDFGIAKATQRSTKTQAGAVKGKTAYMAPEQARGKDVDARTDIFALGIVFWEMLTGRSLFQGDSDYETLIKVLKDEAPAPSTLNPAVSRELDAIVLRCLEKDPADRWPSAEALVAELTRWYYQNIKDPERDKLKPLMFRLFKQDIDRLEQTNLEDEALMTGVSSATIAQEALRAVAATVSGPITDQPTRMDLAHAPVTHSRTAMRELEANQKKRSALPWLLVALLALGGGATAIILMTQGESASVSPTRAVVAPTPTEPTPPSALATLYLKVEPHTARVTVDGQEVTGGEVKGLQVGARVRVVAEASGYKRFEEIVPIDEAAPIFAVKMLRDGVPHRFVIRPPGENDLVFVDDEKIGAGAQTFEGLVGQRVVVRVEPADGGAHVVRSVEVDPAMTSLSIQLPAELALAFEPPGAKVSATPGVVQTEAPGKAIVTGLETGATVKLKVEAAGHTPYEQSITMARRSESLAIRLDKAPVTPSTPTPPTPQPPTPMPQPKPTPTPTPPATARGSISVDAKPWAQVMVDGRPYGQTPRVVKDLAPGKYTVLLTRGTQKVTRTVTVQGGKQANVFVDFTEL